ncbi:hypothetical protein LshimejAT787_2600430 [Lyophyllum shimeji]|uniref:Uncharacterized protein n=1 Tax=Lyophyllum shimeji TaxID=47721 RepID=A0A9P3Q145_LYOSH|nr:hypothetical protein LshimejAT787_2600430 [Lyophyllum shimeji]
MQPYRRSTSCSRTAARASLHAGIGKPFVMFETNSATCGGLPGISDSFGAGLCQWALDYGLTMAAANCSGALLHVGGQNVWYNPFTGTTISEILHGQCGREVCDRSLSSSDQPVVLPPVNRWRRVLLRDHRRRDLRQVERRPGPSTPPIMAYTPQPRRTRLRQRPNFEGTFSPRLSPSRPVSPVLARLIIALRHIPHAWGTDITGIFDDWCQNF